MLNYKLNHLYKIVNKKDSKKILTFSLWNAENEALSSVGDYVYGETFLFLGIVKINPASHIARIKILHKGKVGIFLFVDYEKMIEIEDE